MGRFFSIIMTSSDKMPEPTEREKSARFLLDMVSFDASDWQFDGEDTTQMLRQWVTPENDLVSLNFFSRPPDLPTSGDLVDFERKFVTMLKDVRGRLVELQICPIAGMDAVRQIIKVPIPDKPHGLIYIASWILPFQALSYVLKVQCVERGTTGMRESLLFAQQRAGSAGHTFENDQIVMPNWNPDSPEFDGEFPDHPISRARRVMEQLQKTTQIREQLHGCTPFPLPPAIRTS